MKFKFQKNLLFVVLFIFWMFFLYNSTFACDSNNWLLIFKHDVSSWDLFANVDEAKKINETLDPNTVKKYSILYDLEKHRWPDWKFEFKLDYPNKWITNIWKQTSNPVSNTSRWVDWYEPISIDYNWSLRWWLEFSEWSNTFLDWSVNSTNWRFAVWSYRAYWGSTTIPWPWQTVSLVKLYVCSDKIAPQIIFTWNTPANNSYTKENSFFSDFKIVEDNLNKVKWIFDGIDHTIYNKNTKFQLDFDNIIEIWEVSWAKVVSTTNPKIEWIVHWANRKKINWENWAYEFNSQWDYIKIPNDTALNLDNNYTISVWYYYDTWINIWNYNTLFQRRNQNKTVWFMRSWLMPSNNNIYFQYANWTNIKTISFPNIKKVNQRQHIVFSYEKTTNELKLYVNWELKWTKILANYINPTTDDLYIWSYRWTHNFVWKIDNFKMYWKKMSDSDILELYNNELDKSFKYYVNKVDSKNYNFSLKQSLSEWQHTYQVFWIDTYNNSWITQTRDITKDTVKPTGNISYNPSTLTNNDVIATLNPSEAIIMTNNSWSNTYTFTWNWSFTFEYKDLAWNTWETIATVNRIDKDRPIWQHIEYSETRPISWNVIATLTWFNEPVTILNNNWSNIRTFTHNWRYTFRYRDNAWNRWTVRATVNNIFPEYQIEHSYDNPTTVFASEIHNYIRTFNWTWWQPDRHCIYKTLKIDLWNTGYSIIPARTCYTINDWISSDLNIYNSPIQKDSDNQYSLFRWKANLNIYFDKPIKFAFNTNMFSWRDIVNLFIKSKTDTNFVSNSISNTYYTKCSNWISDMPNNKLQTYNWNKIWYTCKWWYLKLSSAEYVDNSTSNNTWNATTTTWTTTTTTTTNSSTTNNYYYYYNNYYTTNNTESNTNDNENKNIENDFIISDELVKKYNEEDLFRKVKELAEDKGFFVQNNLLETYLRWRKKGLITQENYDEDMFQSPTTKKIFAIIFSRYINNILKLKPNDDIQCNILDTENLDFSSRNYINSLCKYWIIDKTKKYYPDANIVRSRFILYIKNLLITTKNKNIDSLKSNENVIDLLQKEWILNKTDWNLKESKYTILLILKRITRITKPQVRIWNVKDSKYIFTKTYKLGYKWYWVRMLQSFLKKYWVFEWNPTWYFGYKTKNALYQFQLKEWILTKNSNDLLKWYFGPSTRKAVNLLIK